MAAKVLMIGWHPSVVNYSKWPGLTPEKLEAGLRADREKVQNLGHDVQLDFIKDTGTAPEALAERLRSDRFDIVMIGAGVRKDEDHFLLFENLVNVVHEHAPGSRIAFNTGPTDSDAAILRWT